MKRLTFALLIVVFNYGISSSQNIPSWRVARGVMEKCYSGWNGVITVSAGLEGGYDIESSEDSTTSSLISDGSTDSNVFSSEEIDLEFQETTSRSAQRDLFEGIESSENNYSRNGFSSNAYIGISMTVPLYDRATRLRRRESTNRQVNSLADQYAKYEGYRATILALKKELVIAKKLMGDLGHQGIKSYYQMLVDIEKAKALMTSSKRKIMMNLEACGYVERSRINRKGQSSGQADKAKADKQ